VLILVTFSGQAVAVMRVNLSMALKPFGRP
jgi:hypothetical protein